MKPPYPPLAPRVLAVIEASPIPVKTCDLTAIVNDFRPNVRKRVSDCLRRLRRAGLVRVVGSVPHAKTKVFLWTGGGEP